MIDNAIKIQLLGPYILAPDVLKERNQVIGYYNFFNGPAANPMDLVNENMRGQSWANVDSLDYIPTQDIRNHTKKLLVKQARFMFGNSPDILMKPIDKKNKDQAEALRQFIDKILEDNGFWGDTFKAFLDCTIGKRVLLIVHANPGEPIQLRYHTMDEFTFEVDPADYKKLTQVIIAYMDKDTVNKPAKEQIWHRWKYYMENGKCMLTQGTYNGLAEPIKEETVDTQLDEIPGRVIINGGLTGDTQGTSDLRDLIDMQNSYNKTVSDFRDALRFRMFEQPVFIDADFGTKEDGKTPNVPVIAPNAMIDLKTDPAAGENAKADARMLSSNFSFVEAAKEFLDRTKADMYEIMDQPRPEDIKQVPSAKALKFTFYDLMARCEEKWQSWEPAVKWMIRFMIKCIQQFNLYPGEWEKAWDSLDYTLVIRHNYPIPEDDTDKKTTAMNEVSSNVRSIKTYIKEYSDVEDVDAEYQEILQGIKDIGAASADSFQKAVEGELNGEE